MFAQIAVATVAAAVVALLTAILAVRARGIYFLMLTLAFGQLLWELALNWTRVTGGSNGLFGIPQPALGTTDKALAGNDRFYWYALGVFLVGYGALRSVVGSPFGRSSRGTSRRRACPSRSRRSRSSR